ncbi:DoxX family protein [Phyllobacterium leguminum]|uniref:Putative oxidoreductase n=1 Tax=Phyllobacterium leguminum TaxID=314237 RepID=A0A318T874_9HYPH|nr:DoxX family protein [Phyllobacterium leguminum]PYE89511.1 putative oxidoreductase [Phyllobacterium leguminum]
MAKSPGNKRNLSASAINSRQNGSAGGFNFLGNRELQLLLIRVYIGLDFIHHFAEKFGLLGEKAYQDVLHYFTTVTSDPVQMVLLAGLCEFGAFVGFTFGLFTRIAAVGTALYLVIALFVGHHNVMGFTWANPGGGWEYPALWAFICLTYVLTGGGRYSLDRLLEPHLPDALKWLSR